MIEINIQESIKAILSVSEHQKNVKQFAEKAFQDWKQSDAYKEKYKDILDSVWTEYDHHLIMSETKIRIVYMWGGDKVIDIYEYDGTSKKYDHILIDILPEIRDSKLESIGI